MFLTLSNFGVRHQDFKVHVELLALEVGSVMAVVGSNGSGKTTFIEGILGVQQSVYGSKLWRDGTSILDKEKSGVQLQKSGFGDQMLVEDICYLHKFLYKRQEQSLFQDLEIKELMRKQYRNLSRGEKQRVDLFIALAHQPSQIFLDEPKTGLDKTFSGIFMKHFRRLSEYTENSVIYACHSPEELKIADQILWLDQGVVKDFGNKESLIGRHLSKYKIDLKKLSSQQKESYCSTILSLNSGLHEPYIDEDSLLIYGDLALKEWAEKIIISDNIVDYTISSVRENDFLEYLTRKS